MRIVALIDHGPAWDPDKSLYQQGPTIEAHLAAMANRFDEGSLLIGGPFDHAEGGIAVLDVADIATARSVMDTDPAVIAGVLRYELRVVRAYFDAFSRTRSAGPVVGLAPSARPTPGAVRP